MPAALATGVPAALRTLFGDAAPLFPVLVALIGGIVFLEINVPRMIAGLGSSALAYFLIFDALLGAGAGSTAGSSERTFGGRFARSSAASERPSSSRSRRSRSRSGLPTRV